MKTLLRQSLLLIGLALLPAAGQALYYRDKVSWQTPVAASEMVTLPQAQSWSADTIWIDARPQDEFEREHVPGALLLNEDRWNELLPQVLAVWAPEKRVVIYCSSESCGSSREIAHRLRKEAGLTNVFVLEGGWEAWKKEKQ
ncbi:MAG TPA: rhodanese-like domain-containing protein [Chthoniobacterales bacterium]|nr:rhodanese-like domain-containing protein [Chthoniobacterales bacterium]